MITDRRLTARLERTLAAKADQATEPDTSAADRSAFVATSTTAVDEAPATVVDLQQPPTGRRARSTDGRRRPWRLVAAAAAAVAALVGGLVALPGGDAPESDTTTASVAGQPADGWLLPGWVPEDATLWAIDAGTYDPGDDFPDAFAQLLGDPVAGPVMYVTSPAREIAPDSAVAVTVRGQAGSAGTGWGVAEEDLGPAITWEERGVEITALYRGMTEAEALDTLDALEWHSDITAEGFAPTETGLPLRTEEPAGSPENHRVGLQYTLGTPDGPGRADLYVGTSTGNVPGAFIEVERASGATYLETWYLAGTGDGTGPLSTTTGISGEWVSISTVWPDGRVVAVSGDTAATPSLTPDVLERVAESTAEAADGDVDALRASVSARVAALPVLATADTAIGTIEVHGAGGFVRLCRPATEAPAASCVTGGSSDVGTPDELAGTIASWTIDGTWYVAVASPGELPPILEDGEISAPSVSELPAETTTEGDWTIALVDVPADVDEVCVATELVQTCAPRNPY